MMETQVQGGRALFQYPHLLAKRGKTQVPPLALSSTPPSPLATPLAVTLHVGPQKPSFLLRMFSGPAVLPKRKSEAASGLRVVVLVERI